MKDSAGNLINMEKGSEKAEVNEKNTVAEAKDIMRVENLYFKYRKRDGYVIKAAAFSIKEGMLYGMVGKNSTGKSTLLKLLCGRVDKHGGEITLNNHTDIIYIKKNVGIISEEQKLFKGLTVYENGIMFGKIYENFKIEEFLQYINMYNINRNDRMTALSASDIIKVKISLVLARNVKVILLDEPTGVLDISAREELMKLLRDITIEKNIAVVMATHLTENLDKRADYIIFVNEDGTVETEDMESLNDKYMLLKGSRENMKDLPKETIISYEEKETSVTAMTSCYEAIRDRVENTEIITEQPDISAIMYYKDRSSLKAGENEKADKDKAGSKIINDEVKMKRAGSKESTYNDVKRIYDGLFYLYGRKWLWALTGAFLVIIYILILFEDKGEIAWYETLFLVIYTDMVIDFMIYPKESDDGKELYGEIKYLPVRKNDVLKYVLSRIAAGGAIMAVILVAAGYKYIMTENFFGFWVIIVLAVLYQSVEAVIKIRST